MRMDLPQRGWRRWAGSRWPWVLLLLLVALAYYGSYVRSSLNFRDEGGTEVLVAQRLLNGERPFLDLELGYNLLWFYPIVALFKVGGVNYVLLRGACFFLSTLTAITGFFVVTRAGRLPWLGFLAGLLLLVVPGMTFKNFIPFLVVTNGALLACFALARGSALWGWLAAGGAWLGITYLIRIDFGIFVMVLWLGACLFRAGERGLTWRSVLALLLPAPALLLSLVIAVHLPVYWDAQRRGFGEAFLGQYAAWPHSVEGFLRQHFGHPAPSAAPAAPAPSSGAAADLPLASPPVTAAMVSRETLHRKGWAEWKSAATEEERRLIGLLYAPLLTLGVLLGWAAWRLAAAWRQGESENYARALASVLLIGSALTAFPQYFFFRPDAPHLSEFSPGCWVAAFGSLLLLAPGGPRVRPWRPWAIGLLAGWLVFHASFYLVRMVPDRWTGTIAARRKRTVPFHAENGVNVMLTHTEFVGLKPLQELIRQHTRQDDYLVAYPYQPALNVLADRRTYERNVYVDNATAEPGWNAAAIRRLERYRPAVVILDDWEVNGIPASRFSVWAAETRAWLQAHYDYQGKYLELEVYTRR